jgi:long-chain acyl-CoA synthetase
MNLASSLVDTARRHGDSPAIRLDDVTVTYRDLEESSRRVAGLLADYRIAPGDRVALMLPNVAQFAALYYGVLRAGGIVVPMNPLLKDREITHYLADSGARLIFVLAGADLEAAAAAERLDVAVVTVDGDIDGWPVADSLGEVVDRRPEDTAVILYTSGTTGLPKGAELTNANIDDNIEICVETLLHATAEDVIFGGLPLFHVFGQTCTLNVAVRAGAMLTLLPRFDPAAALHILRRDRVTLFEGVPTMYSALLAHAGADIDLPDLRLCVSGASSMPVEVLRAFEERFGCVVLEG